MSTWLVYQKPNSKYEDVEGECYEYPSWIAYAKKVQIGDYLVCTLPIKDSINGRRIFGIGRINDIEVDERVNNGETKKWFKANYGWYRNFNDPFTFKEIGGDPRDKPGTIQSIAPVTFKESELLEILLNDIKNIEEFFEQEERMNNEISPSTIEFVKSISSKRKRDSDLALDMKKIYDDHCQFCNLKLSLPNDSGYSEAAHVKPLGRPHLGDDRKENILVLCPNHHKLLDKHAIYLTSTHWIYDNVENEINFIDTHYIDEKNINYRNKLTEGEGRLI